VSAKPKLLPLAKLPPREYYDSDCGNKLLPRYRHPHGFIIERVRRDWSARGTPQPGWAGPREWWGVRADIWPPPRYVKWLCEPETLREAREYADRYRWVRGPMHGEGELVPA